MKLINASTFVILFLIICVTSTTKAQSNSFDKNVNELVKITTDSSLVYSMRQVLSSDLLKIERQGFKREYDSITTVFFTEFAAYYEKEYKPGEIKQLLEFYKTPLGNKFAADFSRLYGRNLPESNSLGLRIIEMKKNYKEGKFTENATIEVSSSNGKSRLLVDLLSINRYLESIKATAIMNTKDQYDTGLILAFDKLAVDYVTDLKNYFSANYNSQEVEALLEFYKTPLGMKVAKNAGKLIDVTINNTNVWAINIRKINGNLNFGKFQREYLKANPKK